MVRRKDQKFYGVLTDEELYLLEDALSFYADGHKEAKDITDKLTLKLYQDFAELPKKHKLCTTQS